MARATVGKSLGMVARVRRIVTEEARLGLATAIATQSEADDLVRAITDSIAHERDVASSVDSDDRMVEAYIVWLADAATRLESARARQDAAAAATTQARTMLNLAKAAERAVERHIADAAEAARLDDLRRDQLILDEAAQRPALSPGGEASTISRSPLANPRD